LFNLHQLDIIRKHRRLIAVDLTPQMITISAEAHRQGVTFPAAWQGFMEGAIIATCPVDATSRGFHLSLHVQG
jgi:hypothetical protein